MVPAEHQSRRCRRARSRRSSCAEGAKAAGAIGELEARLETDPKDHQARLDLAMALFAAGEREEAIDQLLDHFPPRPQMERGGGPQAARQLFEAIGPTDPLPWRPQAPVLDPVLMSCRSRYFEPRFDSCRGAAVFPLSGALLLPRGRLPLNIFEPRYLAMIDDALATTA